MLGAEPLDLIQLDVGVLRPRHGRASDPPVSAGQSAGQVSAGARLEMVLSLTAMRNNFAMRRLP
jgi:hypothetical protein